ncbi:permease [Arthrobacter sp. LAPM80]|uniref:permease n=1 Tax=Arthrobacter sp. LAPM80 TaxID=3141788 RepID=UPI00398ADA66
MKSSIAGLIGILAFAMLVAGHYLGLGYTMGAGIALAAVFGVGWPHYLGIPAKKTLGAVIGLAGAGAALTAGLAAGSDYLAWTPLYIAVGFGAIMVVQLVRGTGQIHRLESTLGAGAGVLIAGLACGWVASLRYLGEPGLTVIVAFSGVVALLAGMLPWPDRVLAPLTIALAALASPLAALIFSDVRIVPAMVLGIVVGAVIAAFHRLRTLAGVSTHPLGVAAASLAPILSLGSLVYFVEKIVLH